MMKWVELGLLYIKHFLITLGVLAVLHAPPIGWLLAWGFKPPLDFWMVMGALMMVVASLWTLTKFASGCEDFWRWEDRWR